jgi:hypothetical protein
MPCADTFQCEPILGFVQKYLMQSKVSVDPFSRNSRLCQYTNDLNPKTAARWHMDAVVFLRGLRLLADVVVLDMPYSPRQLSECYKEAGVDVGMEQTQNGAFYKDVRDAVMSIIQPGSVVLSFGWNSCGMGKGRGFDLLEVLLVAHGAAHNDTICLAERWAPHLNPELQLETTTTQL